jgi:hypothetical protein
MYFLSLHLGWLKITLDAFQKECQYVFGESIIGQNIHHLQLQLSYLMNGKGEDIRNEIYNWLLACQVRALKDVALFNPCLFYGLWQTQASDRWEEHKDNVFY